MLYNLPSTFQHNFEFLHFHQVMSIRSDTLSKNHGERIRKVKKYSPDTTCKIKKNEPVLPIE